MSGETPEVRRLIERCIAEGLTEIADRLARLAAGLSLRNPRERLLAADDFLVCCRTALRGKHAAPGAAAVPEDVIEAAAAAAWAEAERPRPGELPVRPPLEKLPPKLVAAGLPALVRVLEGLRRSRIGGRYRELAALAGRLVGDDTEAAVRAAREIASQCHIRDLGDLRVPAVEALEGDNPYAWCNLVGEAGTQVERFARKRAEKG